MIYPVDRIVDLLKANGQRALKLAEIARTSGEEYLQLSCKIASGFLGQVQEIKPGQSPGFKSKAGASILSEIEKIRETRYPGPRLSSRIGNRPGRMSFPTPRR